MLHRPQHGLPSIVRIFVASFALFAISLFATACSNEVEVTREVPVTTEVTREIPTTVQVTREVPVTVEVTREVAATTEVTREVPAMVEVTREVTITVEVTREVPVTASAQQGRAATGDRLNLVRDRGKLICASRDSVPGFGYLDAFGNNVGFDIDLCRAVAVAVLGDPNAVEIRPIAAFERGPTIQSGEVDLLVRTVTWTASRDATWGNFVQTMFYDGQGFMVKKVLDLASAMELERTRVCVVQGTTTELNLHDFSNQHGLDIEVVSLEGTDAALASYENGQCDAFTNDRSQLVLLRSLLDDPRAHMILPETISEEPLGPVVPHGDDQWFDIVKTVMAILIYGEAYDISSGSVPTAATGVDAVDRLLGFKGSFGQDRLGLSQTVAQDVLKAVGNYGEIFRRNLGPDSLNLPREGTRNALWADAPCEHCPKGGQIYAAPLR